MKEEQGDSFSLDTINLAELGRRTGITRARLRKLKKDGFEIRPHGNKGRRADFTILSGFTSVMDNLLKLGVTNSAVHFERLQELGYSGGLTTVKNYIANPCSKVQLLFLLLIRSNCPYIFLIRAGISFWNRK